MRKEKLTFFNHSLQPWKDEHPLNNVLQKSHRGQFRRCSKFRNKHHVSKACPNISRTSEHEVDSASNKSNSSLLSKRKKSPSGTSNERDLDDVFSDDSNEVVTVPMHAGKDLAH